MSNVAYDLDTSGGLMPLIRALIKPPDEDPNPPKQKRTQHPYYRRPGKGHNRDCCDACQEGGDLICCDRCPASFHLGCHDPPLEEADIPLGQWLCLECRSAPQQGSPTTSHRSFEGDKKNRSLRVNRSNSCVSSASSSSRSKKEGEDKEREPPREELDPEREKELEREREKEKVKLENLTPMETLIRAARIMNPTQFQLPREMKVFCPFPGTDKEVPNGKQQLPHVKDSWGCVPLPARLCFHCRQSCRAAPLLQCDYCPLLYHQDCLDPPLTALPSGRWMCPNHVEQYIDFAMVNTISASERVALWERVSGPVDQDAVRLEFLRRARAPHPPFRVRLRGAPPRGRVSVPGMVRHHYRRPPPLMPARREHLRCHKVSKTNRNFSIMDSDKEENSKKKIICMNLHCPRYLSKNAICEHDSGSDSSDVEEEQEECALEDLKEILDKSTEEVLSQNKRKSESDLLDTPDTKDPTKKSLVISPKRRKLLEDEDNTSNIIKTELETSKTDIIYGIVTDNAKEIKEILFSVEEQLKKLDGRLVKLLAFQRLQQLMDAANADLDDSIAEIISRSIDKSSLSRYGFKHVALPSELLTRTEMERIAREVCGAVAPRDEVQRLRMVPARPHPPPLLPAPLPPAPSVTAMPVRATLCPIERPARNGLGDGIGRPVPMRLSRLAVGLGGGCDLQLNRYGNCTYVSERHALIFYDEVTHHFELINYSEHGSLVNGQLYSCDFTRGAPAGGGDAAATGAEEKAAALRAIADKRRGTTTTIATTTTTAVTNGPSTPSSAPVVACSCSARGGTGGRGGVTLEAGWEGGALLTHGALLQFGCLMFVFSITDAHILATE